MAAKTETREFQSDAKEILHLMVHSVYSNKEIFLRELISNASDALDRLRFESLTKPDLVPFTSDPHIRIETGKDPRSLTVRDNGIGMNHDEIVEFIGTIAKSGSRECLELLKKGEVKELPPELIGQFGVGFYSSFMVAKKVTLVTRRAGEKRAWRWESAGDGTYTLEETEWDEPGASIRLELKEAEAEDGLEDFAAEWTIRQVVRKYSDFVAYPIRMRAERTEVERDEKGRPKDGAKGKTVVKDETLNSMQAIWTRPEGEVEESGYNEFYKHISHDWNDPLKRISYKGEGTHEFRCLLFIPSRAPFDLFMRDADHGIHLYIKRVFIMNDCKDLIPECLRFIRGVVDSEDLSLNISREILQQNRQIQIIRKAVVRKVLDALRTMLKDERDEYLRFWKEFGCVLREGLFQDVKNRDALLDLCLFQSTHSDDGWCTLEEYHERAKAGQDAIYFMTGGSREAIENSPHLEVFREKGYEALLLTDPVDEIWTGPVIEHKGKKFQSVAKGLAEVGTEEERKKDEEARRETERVYRSLLDHLKEKLDEHVKEVRTSSRLTSSPVCLVGDQTDPSPQLEQLLKASGQTLPKTKRILEVNPNHPILEKLRDVFEKDKKDPRIAEYAELLYGQAVLADGNLPPDPGAFSRRMADVMARGL
jgi:molecular chaperone HtpG